MNTKPAPHTHATAIASASRPRSALPDMLHSVVMQRAVLCIAVPYLAGVEGAVSVGGQRGAMAGKLCVAVSEYRAWWCGFLCSCAVAVVPHAPPALPL